MFKEKSKELFDYTVDIRRKIHENPELSGKEDETVSLVKEELDKAGIRHEEVVSGGILGFIEGKKQVENPKTILLRADLDALPFDEPSRNLKKDRVVTSKNPGAMHACGHDGHTAMLLSTGKILNESLEEFGGKVILCFERGEELGLGYKYILAYLDKHDINVDACYAIHVSPEYESGVMAIKEGGINAGALMFDVTLKGESGHGARPHLANNPLECFVDIYESLKAVRMNEFSPFEPIAYSIGVVEMGNQFNQIPEKLTFKGTARFFDREKVGYKFYSLLRSIIINKARDNGCRVSFNTFTRPHFPIINDKNLASLAKKVMAEEIGSEFIKEANPSMGSDSFAAYNAMWPGLYIMLGISNDEIGSGAALHSDKFDLDEAALKNGIAATASFVTAYLNSDLDLEERPFKDNLEVLFREENRNRDEIGEIYETIS